MEDPLAQPTVTETTTVAPEPPTVTETTTVAPEPPTAPEAPSTDDESDDWDAAIDELYPGVRPPETTETTTVAPEVPETTDTTTVASEAPEVPKTTETTTVAPEVPPEGTDNPPSTPAPVLTEAQLAERREALKSDIAERMFPDRVTELRDADGDPIRTVEDVMKLIDPRTKTPENPDGEYFTQDSAGIWLLYAQQNLNKQIAADEAEIERIADLQLDIQQQADRINEKYGELLKAQPELRADLWSRFSQTLKMQKVKAADGTEEFVYTDMPMALETFYDAALAPHAQLQQQQQAAAAAQQAAAERARQEAEAQARQQRRSDRSDIYTPGNLDTRDDDDRDWEDAHKFVFGDNFQQRIK